MKLLEEVCAAMRREAQEADQEDRIGKISPVMRRWLRVLEDVGGREPPRDLTTAEAAFRLSLTPTTIQRMCKRGELDGVYLTSDTAGEWRIPEKGIEKYRTRRTKRSARLRPS